jgi:glycosyltransferase involved in cell wall biosynthesis
MSSQGLDKTHLNLTNMDSNNIKPLVSVITAFFNEETFLKESVQSVIAQEYDNWEMMLVDDGSTDDSTWIAKAYAEQYPGKIFYLEHDDHSNRSTAASRNLAISKCRGELVAFLDADDVWGSEKLLKQVEIMCSDANIVLLLEASEYWNSWDTNGGNDIIIQVGKETDKLFEPPVLAEFLYPLGKGAAPCPSAIMARRRFLIKHGGFESGFKGKYQLFEDQAFLIKFYLHEKVYISSLCNNRYRQRTGSCVQKVTQEGNYHIVRKYFLSWLELYIESYNITDKKVRHLFKRASEQYKHPMVYFLRERLSRVQKRLLKTSVKVNR